MRSLKGIIGTFILVAVLSFSAEAAGKNKTVNIKTSAVCGSCKARIEKALKATEGVSEAMLNLESKQVKVKYNPEKTSPEALRAVIAKTGYSADEVKADEVAYKKLPHCCQGGTKCEHAKE